MHMLRMITLNWLEKNANKILRPPVVSRFLSVRCRPYVYSVVNNDDAIPRTSVKQLKTLIAGIASVKDFRKKNGGSWKKVKEELDELSWAEIEHRFANKWKEKRYETFIAGRVLLFYDFGKDKKGSVEVAYDTPNLRIPIVSSRMVSDHNIESYKRAFDDGM
jgi:hypothetical protein